MNDNGDILVVDDDRATVALLTDILKDGYVVRPAFTGELALAAVAAKVPELILLDIRLPGINGFEVLERLQAEPETSGVPVIILSGIAETEERVKGLRLGAVDFISKPFQKEELLAKAATQVELYRLRLKLEQQTRFLERDMAEILKSQQALKESEAKFRALFENSNDAVFLHGMTAAGEAAKFIEVNAMACERLGYTREELLELTPADISAAGTQGNPRKITEELVGSGHIVFEMLHIAKDGRKIPVEISSRVFEYGGLPLVLSMARDITERKRAQAALLESSEQMDLLINSAAEAIYGTDLNGNCTFCNKACLRLLGYKSPEELLGKNMHKQIHSKRPDGTPFPEEACLIHKAVSSGGEIHSDEEMLWRSDGACFPVEYWSYPQLHNGKPIGAVVSFFDISERVRAVGERSRLSTAIEQASDAIVITDTKGTIGYVNPAFEKLTGYSRGEALGVNPRVLKSGKQDGAFYSQLWGTISSGKTWSGRMVNKRKDGTLYTEDATISPVLDPAGKILNYVAVKKDITEQLRLERQSRQSQKMEAVGLLAGGIAHDFNNILTAIKGYGSMVTNALMPEDPSREDMKEIMNAADRATTLTRQLLAFSRKQIMAPKVVDLNKIIGDMMNMLRRIIGEDIRISVKLFPAPCLAMLDPGQIEHVIVNLVLNARDAISTEGKIILETEIKTPPEDFFRLRPDLPRGPMVCFNVLDNGTGMSTEVRQHLFEPFFTTKEQGKGTGLGLSMVYGIVKQSGGDIHVESQPGRGTVFSVCFPLVQACAQELPQAKTETGPKTGAGTVLLVEDEESLRRLGERLLKGLGYTVLTAADGKDALNVIEKHGKAVDLLLTDVVMPGMGGRELAAELERRKLAGRTLYMSGYTDETIVKEGVLEPGIAFIYKPFTAEALSVKLREVLDGPAEKAKA